ncbi:hypothetical protein [Candidatus Pelagibacter sp. HIMB1321]|uniref:hypothetical protein n=1 Tax=Candidatus Pelagibacter sp. HIMB1321 TaxID=1388755 RepID=UPI000A07E590|nr:hypothetical protein [Candidatus Pelagibacter sp. HIMB1321]SMF78071.1 hypothetical protein SAMN02744631_0890 [Candidatus Pelagibacter sp. HIMB1321]
MSEQINKPYVLKAAEKIYFNVCKIKDENKLDNEKAIESFIKTDHYEKLCTGDFHNEWLNLIRDNKNIDPETNQKIPDETLKLLEIQRDAMMKELIKIPKLYDTKNNQLIELSKKAYNFLWRMCESYELWCRETKQENLITLKIID